MILLISIEKLKREFAVDSNLDDSYMLPNIVKGQDFLIKPLLGDTLYSQICTEIEAANVSALHAQLLKDYIQPTLAYFVLSEVFYTTGFKLKNAGESDQNFDEIIKISNKYRNDSRHYESLTRDFMIKAGLLLGIDYPKAFKCPIFLGNSDNFYTYNTSAKINNRQNDI